MSPNSRSSPARFAVKCRKIHGQVSQDFAYSANRSGFRDLMARIGAGEVGIVLGLEVSRLARDNADWHQLLRIAGTLEPSTPAGRRHAQVAGHLLGTSCGLKRSILSSVAVCFIPAQHAARA